MTPMRFYGTPLPDTDLRPYPGKLIAIEGTDGVGRSTHIAELRTWLEAKGYAVADTGMTRSELAGRGIKRAKAGHTLGKLTMQLFYATDFADQLERVIIPSLKAGFVVLADRYIYTLMARDIVRGSALDWLKDIYGFALVPDAVFYLNVNPKTLAERNFQKRGYLDYWESGMDIMRVGGMYDNFIKYQGKLHRVFEILQKEFGFTTVPGGRSAFKIAKEIRTRIEKILTASSAAEKSAMAHEISSVNSIHSDDHPA